MRLKCLSAKSASGKFPLEAVTIMNRIIEQVEADPQYRQLIDASHTAARPGADVAEAVCCAARRRREGFAKEGETIVAIAGMPFGTPGTTNLMRIATV
jgi:pyruvate kinase